MNTDLVTHIVASVFTLTNRKLAEIQGYESHAEAAKEGDQVLADDGHKDKGPRNSLQNVTNACSMA